MNKDTANILKEYRAMATLYREFSDAVKYILERMLNHGEYKYHISSRVKDIQSLEKKIERKRLKGKVYKQLKDIKDIAGVRVIFYTESDRRKFIKRMQKEFDRSLLIKKTFKISGYRAVHAILSLGEERLKLSEYRAFKDLECEIQLSLILEHAWAEIEHGILYKENWGFKEADTLHYLHMKEHMERIMKNYIHKASTDLEKIVLQYKKIERSNKK